MIAATRLHRSSGFYVFEGVVQSLFVTELVLIVVALAGKLL